ncbi:MAG: hypothetical protein LM576_07945 [Thermofilum sp.]|nr:hypothetical protein [Thermofilum sp.]
MSVKVSKVRDEVRGEVYYVFVTNLPDNLSPIRFLIWRCPLCGAEIRGWTPSQLNAAVRSHKKKHVDARWEP